MINKEAIFILKKERKERNVHMKYYLAPLEGITTYIYRNAYHKIFHPMDKYFTPFIVPKSKKGMSSRERNDILPEHNKGLYVVPQLLTNQAEDFIQTAKVLMEYGYQEINLNLGCPSGTVVAKKKGAGFLAQPIELKKFLDEIFSQLTISISIKTRLGMEEAQEFESLLKIFNQYPLKEIIIHPRVRADYYKNMPNMLAFRSAFERSCNSVCYNGNIFSDRDFAILCKNFPELSSVMLGRGVIANPNICTECEEMYFLQTESKSKKGKDQRENLKIQETYFMQIQEKSRELQSQKEKLANKKEQFKEFHAQIYEEYQRVLSDERNVLFKMKEIWSYMVQSFSNYEIYEKKIKKSESLRNYKAVINALFREQEVIDNGRFSF